jgi:hypothetical protein
MAITFLDTHTIEVAAHHEAGHAVMAWHFRNAIRHRGVTIDTKQPGSGNVDVRP